MTLRRDYHNRHSPVDQGDRAMLHFPRWIPLGMDIRDLLELEGSFQGKRIVDSPSEIEEVRTVIKTPGHLDQLGISNEDLLGELRHLHQLFQ